MFLTLYITKTKEVDMFPPSCCLWSTAGDVWSWHTLQASQSMKMYFINVKKSSRVTVTSHLTSVTPAEHSNDKWGCVSQGRGTVELVLCDQATATTAPDKWKGYTLSVTVMMITLDWGLGRWCRPHGTGSSPAGLSPCIAYTLSVNIHSRNLWVKSKYLPTTLLVLDMEHGHDSWDIL